MLNQLQEGRVATLHMPIHRDDDVIMIAIRYMYGISISDTDDDFMSSFSGFAELAGVAGRLEITGLAELALETACRIVDSCLDDPVELGDFLQSLDVDHEICHSAPSHARFTLRFMMENLNKLRNQPLFRKECSELQMKAVNVVSFVAENPELAINFVKFVAEMQGGTKKSK